MTQASFVTHEVLNQSPPFEDVNLFALDRPLAESVAVNGGASAQQELSEFGEHWGSAAMAARGRVANENTPKLRTFDARGNRRDEVEFHPAYHELMARSAHAGVHNSTWNAEGRPAGGAAEVVRAAKFRYYGANATRILSRLRLFWRDAQSRNSIEAGGLHLGASPRRTGREAT
jgi:putative acyl-CoA dehydrogenase